MKKKLFTLVVAMLTLLSTSCKCEKERPDGDWDPMKWTSSESIKSDSIVIPAEGGSFTMTCSNYTKPWFCSDMEGFVDWHHIKNDWINGVFEDNVATFTYQPNPTGQDRLIIIHFTAGDIFKSFTVIQR